MGICWYCHWGWPKQVADIYLRAVRDIDAALEGANCEEPEWGENAMDYGPAHIVWADENFDGADYCLEYCEDPRFANWHPPALEIVRRSLRELLALPEAVRECEPEDYDDEHPENYPPPPELEMVREHERVA